MRELKRGIWHGKVTITVDDPVVFLHSDDRTQISRWLNDNIGLDNWGREYVMAGKFDYYFKSESDATLFALRWSHVQG